MLIGQSVLAPTGGATYFSPWFPRQGDAFTVVIEYMLKSGALSLTCEVETKDQEDDDASTTSLGSFPVSVTTPSTTTTGTFAGALGLVRYKFIATGTSSLRWIHFRSDAPIWQPN